MVDGRIWIFRRPRNLILFRWDVDGTNSTRHLFAQLKDDKRKLIVTTIQKLDRLIAREQYRSEIAKLHDAKVVIILTSVTGSSLARRTMRSENVLQERSYLGLLGRRSLLIIMWAG